MELATIKNNNRDNNGNDSEEQLQEEGMEVQSPSAESVEEGINRDTLGRSSSKKSWWERRILFLPTPGLWAHHVYCLLLIGLLLIALGCLNASQDVYHIYFFMYWNVLLGCLNVNFWLHRHYWKIRAYLSYDENAFGSVNEDGRPVRVSRLDPAIAIDWETDRPNKCIYTFGYLLWSGISGAGLGAMWAGILVPLHGVRLVEVSIWSWVWVGSWQLALFAGFFLAIASIMERMRHKPNRAVFAEHGEDGVYHVAAGIGYYYFMLAVLLLLVLMSSFLS